ncbi:MAG: cell division protein ZapA [Bacteroidota bacterium]
MSNISVKVVIAGRTYPITVKLEEENQVKQAAKLINDKIKEYEENYFVRDKQDLLAMCALQIANEMRQAAPTEITPQSDIASRIIEIEKFVSDYLKRE